MADFSDFDPFACPEAGYGERANGSPLGCYLNPLFLDGDVLICSRCGLVWTQAQMSLRLKHRGGKLGPGFFVGHPPNLPYPLWRYAK